MERSAGPAELAHDRGAVAPVVEVDAFAHEGGAMAVLAHVTVDGKRSDGRAQKRGLDRESAGSDTAQTSG